MSPAAKASSGKDHAKRRKFSHPVGMAPSSSAAGHPVSQSSLPWSTVQLPGEAVATGGFTEQDFFEGLDDAEDDFMGLKEVEGVQVVYQDETSGGKTVKFIVGAAPGKSKVGDAMEMGPDPFQVASNAAELHRAKKRKQSKGVQAKDGEPVVALHSTEAQTRISQEDRATSLPPSQDSEESNSKEIQNVSNNTSAVHSDAALAGIFSAAAHKVGDEDLDRAPFDDRLLPAWKNLGICSALKRGLLRLSFQSPTAIQSATLPHALGRSSNAERGAGEKRHRDIVGVAQTGSGKTLAYGLPILQYLIEQRHELATYRAHGDFKPLTALVLAPTRELALQVSDHLRKVVEAVLSDPEDVAGASRPPYFAQIATVCGGMSIQKQRRQLERGSGADVIIATPGRIWELLREDDHLARRVKQVRFLVVDEADRMIETGHFAEMEQILSLVKISEAAEAPLIAAGKASTHQQIVSSALGGQDDMQTFVFSATLSKELQKNLKKGSRRHRHGSTSTLDELMNRIDFRDDDPLVVDLSPNTGVAESLTEAKVECLNSEKDLYLYYILLRYPGRTLVFVNSIDSIRRLHPIFVNLGIHVFPLHSQLQQKQRLKHLDRFRATALSRPGSFTTGKTASTSSCVLLATDVAARGLDIPAVDHVVHYQIPRSADTYVHRSGRTARAGKSGVAIALVEPSEKRLWRDLCRSLKKSDDTAILPIEYSFLASLRERLTLSRQIDQAQHKQAKISHDSAWLRDLAEGADLDLVSDMEMSEDDDGTRKLTDPRKGGKAAQAARAKVARLKGQLEDLLARPLSARGVSHRYLTSGSTGFVDDLISNTHHEAMIGVATSTAQSDLGSVKGASIADSAADRAGKDSKAVVRRGTAASKRQSASSSIKRKRPIS